ncbi:MAG TPA: FtsW/RodA/SpoVE family cell cycle protein, partial [Anaerolineales bacterium]|nr:FtsW/RodA/SpoVE family cell cycle protein [Anaerolineales bacterium]
MSAKTASPLPKLQRRLLTLAALFLGAYALALTLAPFVRQRSWNADLLWQHWIGYLVWLALFYVVQRAAAQRLPQADPFLIPIAALLSGWGLLSIFRLFPAFGLRQAAWLTVAAAVLVAGMGLSSRLGFLRRYKYLWLTSGLLLTGLTLVFGANPLGYGPRMWLGCCGIYLQPSEPLKLLLIIYLAAYLADRQPLAKAAQAAPPLLPLLAPTLI